MGGVALTDRQQQETCGSLRPDADGSGSGSLLGPGHICIFESSQSEGSYVGDLLSSVTAVQGEKYTPYS